MRQTFESLADYAFSRLEPDEALTLTLSGERSDFVRFNQSRVRQAGTVEQATLEVRLTSASRQVRTQLSLSLDPAGDREALDQALDQGRLELAGLPEDPHLQRSGLQHRRVVEASGPRVDAARLVQELLAGAEGLDLVGLLASGPVQRGLATQDGQFDWWEQERCVLDLSAVVAGALAAKGTWTPAQGPLGPWLDALRRQAADLRRPKVERPPGVVRAYLAPAAVAELLELLAWSGGFSARALNARHSPLQQLYEGQLTWSPRVRLGEAPLRGGAPTFQEEGFLRPDYLPLVDEGRAVGRLISPRTAAELNLPCVGASSAEKPEALVMEGGDLAPEHVLSALGTGAYITNLWYTNWSDRQTARATGMTRFATTWVEGGEVVGPLSAMRFDQSLHALFGPALEALTTHLQVLPDTSTYGQRAVGGLALPGLLTSAFTFVL